jgi:hypothetical protein
LLFFIDPTQRWSTFIGVVAWISAKYQHGPSVITNWMPLGGFRVVPGTWTALWLMFLGLFWAD